MFLTTLALKLNARKKTDANFIYKYTYSAAQSISYTGETSKQVFRRIADHCERDKKSAILVQLFSCTQCLISDIEQKFRVFKRCKQSELYSLESILIKEERYSNKKY